MKIRSYFLPKEKGELILKKNGIKLPKFTELDVLVLREPNNSGEYDTYLECRDSWGFGVQIWIEERKMRYLASLGDPDEEWKSIE